MSSNFNVTALFVPLAKGGGMEISYEKDFKKM